MIKVNDLNVQLMLHDLKSYDYLQLSLQPDVPGEDENIIHKLISHKVIETKKGLVLILDLENTQTGEKYTYSYSDIVQVGRSTDSNQYLAKYYLHCINREKEYKIQELMKSQKLGRLLTEEENDFLVKENEINTYRIMCTNIDKR
jgi:hypothetical protein